MPHTILIFAYRKPGTTPADFRQHYEHVHVPLLQSIAGPDFPLSHTRYYIQRSESSDQAGGSANPNIPATVFAGTQEDFDYDAFALLTFKDEAAFQAFFAKVSTADAAAQIAEDEENFLDRAKLKISLVGEVITTTKA